MVALLVIVATSCANDNTTGPVGTVSLKLTDAPVHYDQFMSANVDIPVGDYNLMRLYISSTEMINGDSFTYNMDQDRYSGNGMMLKNENRSLDITLDNVLTMSEGGG